MISEKEISIARAVFEDAINTMKTKGDTYASDLDVLRNFKVTGKRLGLTPFQTLMVYMDKHLEALFNAVNRFPENPHCSDGELKDKVKDIIVYCVLFLCLLEETNEQ